MQQIGFGKFLVYQVHQIFCQDDRPLQVVSKYSLSLFNIFGFINLFPNNTQEGFDTEALPSIWENKEEFDTLMTKAANDMLQLTSVIEDSDDIESTLGKFMWGNCKACHNKFRVEQ